MPIMLAFTSNSYEREVVSYGRDIASGETGTFPEGPTFL